MGTETRSRAQGKPSGPLNHPKYHSQGSDVCPLRGFRCCCLSDVELSVCPACLSVFHMVAGTGDLQYLQWQLTHTQVNFEAFETADWPDQWHTKTYVHPRGAVQRLDIKRYPNYFTLITDFSAHINLIQPSHIHFRSKVNTTAWSNS